MKKILLESSLNRIRQMMINHNTGFITANRSEYSKEENIERNEALLIDLQRLYNVTKVRGSYIEKYGTPEAKEVGENSFFVAEPEQEDYSAQYIKKHSLSLKGSLFDLGQKYEQDSVLFAPQGGKQGILIGTKEGAWPGLGKEVVFSYPVFGKDGQLMSKIRGRPFVFLNEAVTGYFKNEGPGNWFTEFGRFLRTCKYDKKK